MKYDAWHRREAFKSWALQCFDVAHRLTRPPWDDDPGSPDDNAQIRRWEQNGILTPASPVPGEKLLAITPSLSVNPAGSESEWVAP